MHFTKLGGRDLVELWLGIYSCEQFMLLSKELGYPQIAVKLLLNSKKRLRPTHRVGCKRLIFCGYSIKPLGEITSPLSKAI